MTWLLLHEQAEGGHRPLPVQAERALGFLHAVADHLQWLMILLLLQFHEDPVQGAAWETANAFAGGVPLVAVRTE